MRIRIRLVGKITDIQARVPVFVSNIVLIQVRILLPYFGFFMENVVTNGKLLVLLLLFYGQFSLVLVTTKKSKRQNVLITLVKPPRLGSPKYWWLGGSVRLCSLMSQ